MNKREAEWIKKKCDSCYPANFRQLFPKFVSYIDRLPQSANNKEELIAPQELRCIFDDAKKMAAAECRALREGNNVQA